MAGLDSVTQTETTEESTVTPQVTPAAAPKGSRYALPTVKGTVGLDSSILQQMQQIIAEKEAKRNSFGEGLRDVMAFDVGYRGDLNKGLRERAAEKEQSAADIFNMKSQIAQYKAAQENQKAFEARRNKELGLGGDTTGVAAAPGAQPAGGGMTPEIRNALMNARTEEEYKKIYNDWAKEQAKIKSQYEYNTALDQIVQFPVDGQLQDMTLRQAKKLAENNPALKAKLDAIYPTAATTAPVAAPVATTAPAVTTTAPTAPSAPAAAPVAPVAAAPAAPAGPRPGVGGASSTEIKANIELQKEIEGARGKERVKEEEGRLATVLDQARKAGDRIDTANRINAIAEADPEMFGVLNKPGVTSSLGVLLKEGIKVGTHGQIALPSIEDMVRRNDPKATPEKLSRAREMEGYLRKVELDFSSAFKGQGAVSDNERKIVQAIAGSTSDPADLLRKKAAWMSMSAQKDRAIGDAWRQFQGRFGDNVSLSRFERSPEYTQILKNHEQNLARQFQSEVQSYGNRPLVSAEEYDKSAGPAGKKSKFAPSASQTDLVKRYLKPKSD